MCKSLDAGGKTTAMLFILSCLLMCIPVAQGWNMVNNMPPLQKTYTKFHSRSHPRPYPHYHRVSSEPNVLSCDRNVATALFQAATSVSEDPSSKPQKPKSKAASKKKAAPKKKAASKKKATPKTSATKTTAAKKKVQPKESPTEPPSKESPAEPPSKPPPTTSSVAKRLSKAAKAAYARRKLQKGYDDAQLLIEQEENKDRPPLHTMGSIRDLTRVIDRELASPKQHEVYQGTTHMYSRRKVKSPQEHSSVMNLLEHNQLLDQQNNQRLAKQKKKEQQQQQELQQNGVTLLNVVKSFSRTDAVAEVSNDDESINSTSTVDDDSNSTLDVESPMSRLRASHVAVVFSKPVVRDHISIEYASRLMSLAQAMKTGSYKPSLICLLTSPIPSADENKLTDGTVGYIFFQHLCRYHDIDLSQIEVSIVPAAHSSIDGVGSLHPVTQAIEHGGFLKRWLAESKEFERNIDEYGQTRDLPRKKVHIHFRLFSSDYHLCNLNDIYQRSPRQSVLNTLQSMSNPSSSPSIRERGVIATSWSFQYSTYPFVYAKEDLTAFLGKCYVTAQQLRPLLVNLRAVMSNAEFFQADNYRQLVAVRRSLVTQIEELNNYYYNQNSDPGLDDDLQIKAKISLKRTLSQVPTKYGTALDVTLENALLNLGRCLDLIRPAGAKTGRAISVETWSRATNHLEIFLEHVQACCDPDRPLDAKDWGKLVMDNVTITALDHIDDYDD